MTSTTNERDETDPTFVSTNDPTTPTSSSFLQATEPSTSGYISTVEVYISQTHLDISGYLEIVINARPCANGPFNSFDTIHTLQLQNTAGRPLYYNLSRRETRHCTSRVACTVKIEVCSIMYISGIILFYITLLVSNTIAAPILTEWNDELVARHPTKTFAHAAQAARLASQINKKVQPRPNGSVFWSGSRPDHNGKMVTVLNDARKIAKMHGKETLEDHMDRKKIHIPLKSQNPHSKKLWGIASNAFAQRTKGETHAYLGPVQRHESVYKNHEKPTLMNSHHVTKLTEHHLPHGGSHVVKGHKRR
ncbi:hypothetical protein BDN70DRAFT_320592 [Pholiota conissans]|uniref:Uncharacterized protein n=1 Tax=Pholiota conissans TaxID=109636 RepID=A0A9P6CPV1_9AGAR|nr:hypothetical protein BDN70DRAFT_320592 [Pholiota conissans]